MKMIRQDMIRQTAVCLFFRLIGKQRVTNPERKIIISKAGNHGKEVFT